MKFSALNVDFSSSIPDPKFKELAGVGGRRKQLPPKSGCFTAIGPCSVKTVADKQRHAAYHNKQQ